LLSGPNPAGYYWLKDRKATYPSVMPVAYQLQVCLATVSLH